MDVVEEENIETFSRRHRRVFIEHHHFLLEHKGKILSVNK